MRRALRTQPGLGPVHIGEEMIGLHRRDYFQFLELRNLKWIRDLSVLHAQAELGEGIRPRGH